MEHVSLTFKPFEVNMAAQKYVCDVCGYEYDPENENGVAFDDLPDDWVCPVCGAGKDEFHSA